jgi:hypothetical protein
MERAVEREAASAVDIHRPASPVPINQVAAAPREAAEPLAEVRAAAPAVARPWQEGLAPRAVTFRTVLRGCRRVKRLPRYSANRRAAIPTHSPVELAARADSLALAGKEASPANPGSGAGVELWPARVAAKIGVFLAVAAVMSLP